MSEFAWDRAIACCKVLECGHAMQLLLIKFDFALKPLGANLNILIPYTFNPQFPDIYTLVTAPIGLAIILESICVEKLEWRSWQSRCWP